MESLDAGVVLWTEDHDVNLVATIREATRGEGAYGAIDCVAGALTS